MTMFSPIRFKRKPYIYFSSVLFINETQSVQSCSNFFLRNIRSFNVQATKRRTYGGKNHEGHSHSRVHDLVVKLFRACLPGTLQ